MCNYQRNNDIYYCGLIYTNFTHACWGIATLQWKIHCYCYALPPVFSSSGHNSDGVVCVTLEVSEGGVSCCWVTELQEGLTTSLRMVSHMGGVEAAGSWV